MLLAKLKAKTARAKNGNGLLTGEYIVASLETVDPSTRTTFWETLTQILMIVFMFGWGKSDRLTL